MKLQVVFKNLEDDLIKDRIREYLEKRLGNLDRYSNHIVDGEFVIAEERGRFNATTVVKVKGAVLKATSTGKDPFEVIDQIKDKLKGQLMRYEEKLKLEARRKNHERVVEFEA